jgi:hypothetical protein
MAFAHQAFERNPFDIDEGLAILTEMIVSEIGPPAALARGEARAAAVARVERLLANLMTDEPAQDARTATVHDHESDIQFGRTDAEFLFEESRWRA